MSSPGIVAAAQVILPKDCNGNKFCEIMKLIVGPTVKWYIYGTFEYRKIRIATGFANVRIYDGLYFHKLELFVEVSITAFIYSTFFRGGAQFHVQFERFGRVNSSIIMNEAIFLS